MKTYYFIVSLLSTVGVSLLLSDYPVLIGIISFGIAIGYRNEIERIKDSTQPKEKI